MVKTGPQRCGDGLSRWKKERKRALLVRPPIERPIQTYRLTNLNLNDLLHVYTWTKLREKIFQRECFILRRITKEPFSSPNATRNASSKVRRSSQRTSLHHTSLLKIHNDIICNMDNGKVTALTLLDLSAAFDTIDHATLLERLHGHFGISAAVLQWFKSYITNRQQRVHIDGSLSCPQDLHFGVPQGSVLGPFLLCLYTKCISKIGVTYLYPLLRQYQML